MSDTPVETEPEGPSKDGSATAARPSEIAAPIAVPAAESHPHTTVWSRIKQHKIAEWTLAYVAFAFALLHGVTLLRDALEWPHVIVRSLTLLLIIGVPVVPTLAWYHGVRALKRVTGSELIIIALLLLIGGSLLWLVPRPAAERARNERAGAAAPAVATATPAVEAAAAVIPEKSVAVLPFVDMSEKKDQEYFSDGMSEELIDMLTRIPDLKVPARTSSFYFKGKQATIAEIAKALGVAHVLEGSVRKSGKTLRVTAQLIRMDSGYHMWSQTYDRNIKDIFRVQDEIATAVVEALKAQLLPAQQAGRAHHTANTEAYNEYLLGRQFYNQRSDDGFRRALVAYRKAIALDPGYAAAYAGLAMSEALLADSSGDALSAQQAAADAESAVTLAPDLADSYAARGFVRYYRGWDWSGAEADFLKAMALDPSDSTVQVRYGGLLVALGRLEEGIAATKSATGLDPLSALAWHRLGRYYIATRQFAAAHDAIRRALEIQPEYAAAKSGLGMLLLLEGNAAEALVTFRQVSSESSRLSGVAIAAHTLGHSEESQRALDELIEKHSRDSAFLIAETTAWRGDKEQAFAWLERAYERHESSFFNLKSEPRFGSLLGDPRYQALLRKLNLPQ